MDNIWTYIRTIGALSRLRGPKNTQKGYAVARSISSKKQFLRQLVISDSAYTAFINLSDPSSSTRSHFGMVTGLQRTQGAPGRALDYPKTASVTAKIGIYVMFAFNWLNS